MFDKSESSTVLINDVRGNSFSIVCPSTKSLKQSFFAFSHPKAGSTLLNNVLTECCECCDFSVLNLPNQAYRQGIQQRFFSSSIDRFFETNGFAYLGWRLFPYETTFDFHYVKSVYLIRDVRDMLVSLFFSKSQSHMIPEKGIAREAFLKARKEVLLEELNNWAIKATTYGVYRNQMLRYREKLLWRNTRVYRYEDVIFRKREWIKDMDDFLGFELSDRQIRRIADRHDIRPERENPKAHIRQVSPGNYRKKLSQHAIEILNEQFADILCLYGYDQEINGNEPICYSHG